MFIRLSGFLHFSIDLPPSITFSVFLVFVCDLFLCFLLSIALFSSMRNEIQWIVIFPPICVISLSWSFSRSIFSFVTSPWSINLLGCVVCKHSLLYALLYESNQILPMPFRAQINNSYNFSSLLAFLLPLLSKRWSISLYPLYSLLLSHSVSRFFFFLFFYFPHSFTIRFLPSSRFPPTLSLSASYAFFSILHFFL